MKLKPSKNLLKKLVHLKTLGRTTGIIGVLISLYEAFDTTYQLSQEHALSVPDLFFQLLTEIVVILFTIDRQIADNVDALHDATGLTFIWLGLSIYGKIWLLLFLTRKASSPILNTAVSDDMPKYPVYGIYLLTFILFMTPLIFIAQIFGVMIDQGEVTWNNLRPPWIGLYTAATNIELILQPLWQIIQTVVSVLATVVDWLPYIEEETFRLGNETLGNETSLENQTTTLS